MGPYAGDDYYLPLRPLKRIYSGQPYTRVNFIPQLGI